MLSPLFPYGKWHLHPPSCLSKITASHLYTSFPLHPTSQRSLTDSTTQMLFDQSHRPFSPSPIGCAASITSSCAILMGFPVSVCSLCLVAGCYMATRGILLKPAHEAEYNMMTRGVPGTNGHQCKVSNSYFPLEKSQIRIHCHSS